MDLDDREKIGAYDTQEYIALAADSFTDAALDDLSWAGDAEGRGENPLNLGSYAWAPVKAADVADAYTDDADSPETQIRNALGSDRAVEIVELLGIGPRVFGDRLYYDQNGDGTGFWDMDFSRPEYRELSDLIGYHAWSVEYDYDPETDPDGDNITLYVQH